MTEAGSVCLASADESDQPEHRRGSFGRPVPGFEARSWFGVGAPKDTRLGFDVAGTVEAVGPEVTLFKPGDEVFGVE